jgi:transcriptional regulator with XRE-family HTH domain
VHFTSVKTEGVVQGMASNLLSQVAERTATFLKLTGLTQTRLSRHLNISDSSLSQFLSGNKGLESSTLIRLCQVLSLSKAEVTKKSAKRAVARRF